MPFFPASASLAKVVLVFVGSFAVFSLWLVWWLKIGKRGLRIVECVWIPVSGLTIIKYVGDERQITALSIARQFDQLEPRVYDPLRFLVELYSGPVKGPACMEFNRSALFATQEEFDRMQRDFDGACAWFEQMSSQVPLNNPIDRSTLPVPPQVSNADLKKQIAEFSEKIDAHNEAARRRATLDEASARSEIEWTRAFLAPLIIASAVALRLTKVLGEWMLDRRLAEAAKAGPSSPALPDSPGDGNPSATDDIPGSIVD